MRCIKKNTHILWQKESSKVEYTTTNNSVRSRNCTNKVQDPTKSYSKMARLNGNAVL